MLIALSGCSSTTNTGSDGGSEAAVLESIPPINADAATVTPAPSGFVPGDSLPTPIVYALSLIHISEPPRPY